MKNTWMTHYFHKNQAYLLELYFYYNLLFTIFPVFLFRFSFHTCLSFFKKQFEYLNYMKLMEGNTSLFFYQSKNFNKYLNMQISFKIDPLNQTDNFNFDDFSIIKKNVFINKISEIKNNMLNVFFFLNYSYFNSQFSYNSLFKLFYVKDVKNQVMIFDISKIFLRWNDAYNLLFNIFYYNLNPVVMGSPFFKNEILALNWTYSSFDFNLWRYYFPFFFFKLNKYNRKTSFFFERLSNLDINFFIVTDCHYHYKNLHYIKKKHYYSVGLIDVNTSPWLVSYPIMAFFESFLSQSFFFKLLLFIERQVFLIKYNFLKKTWLLFLFKRLLVN